MSRSRGRHAQLSDYPLQRRASSAFCCYAFCANNNDFSPITGSPMADYQPLSWWRAWQSVCYDVIFPFASGSETGEGGTVYWIETVESTG